MTSELLEIHIGAWDCLNKAVDDSASPFRYLSLCTVSESGRPQSRLLVLRNVDSQQLRLEFHTDTRSPKWRELETSPYATVLGFDPQQRLQIRLQGQVELYGPKSEINRSAWSNLSLWTQNTYSGGPPGDPLVTGEPISGETIQPSYENVEHGRNRFGVLMFQARKLDYFRLQRTNNRRALFEYSDPNSEPVAYWVMP